MKLIVHLRNGNDLTITEDKMLSWEYKADSSTDNEFVVGFCCAAGLNFAISNFDGTYSNIDFNGCTIDLYKDDVNVIGKFNFKVLTRKNDIMNFQTLDNMEKFDVRYTEDSFSGTVEQLVKKCCINCGVQAGSSLNSFLNKDIQINNNEQFLNASYREILQAALEISGCFGYIDSQGQLQFGFYDLNTVDKQLPYNSLMDFEREEVPNNITDISCVVNGIEVRSYDSQPTGYELYLANNNFLLLYLTENEIKTVLNNIKTTRFTNFSFYSLNLKTQIDYDCNIGDVIEVQDKDLNYYKAIITNLTFTNSSAMKINSAGENKSRNYTNITNKDGGTVGGAASIFRSHKTNINNATISTIAIKNVKEGSQCFFHLSGEGSGTITALLNGVVVKTFTFGSYGFVLPLEYTMPENTLEVSGTGTDIEISLLMVNCNAEETVEPTPDYIYIDEADYNIYDTLLIRKEEIL